MTDEHTTDDGIDLPTKSVDHSRTLSDRLTDNVQNRIGPARYFKKDADGNPTEDWAGVFNRVASDVASAEPDDVDQEYWTERFEQAMREQRFMPNTPTIASAGTELQMLSACFVSSPEDSMEDILDTAKEWGLVEKTGGGMGGAFYKLRPKGQRVSTTGGKASGPIPFIKLFDSVGGSIKQGGCVDASARVMSDDGYVPLWEVHDGRPLQRAGGESSVLTSDGFDAVQESSDSGEQPVVSIETEDGFSIDVTPNHEIKVLTDDGFDFVEAEDISSGDTVVLDQSGQTPSTSFSLEDPSEPSAYHHNTQTVPAESYPDQITKELATVLGIIAGDGTVDTNEDRIIASLGNDGNADSSAVDWFVGFFESMGFNVTQRDRSGSEKGNYTRYEVRSQQLLDWFETNDLIPSNGDRPSIPEPVYRSPEHLINFCNGCTVDAGVNTDANTVVYSTAYEAFSEELQQALLASGVPSNRSFIESGSEKFGDNGVWTVRVGPGTPIHLFEQSVDLLLDGEFSSGGQRQNQITVPGFIDSILDEHFEKRTETDDAVDASSLKSLRRYARGDRTASLNRIRSLLNDVQVDPDDYREFDTDVLYDVVDSVEESGTKHVCDIENVSGRPEFVADNFSVHNIRSGAQMAIMHAHHADVGRFAVSKREEGALSNFNISVAVTDEFVAAVENDEQYTFRTADSLGPGEDEVQCVLPETKHFYSPEFKDAWNDEYDKPAVGIDGETVDENVWRDYDIEGIGEYRDRIDLTVGEPMELPARFIWQLIVDGAWENGEPGVVHIEEADRQHSFDTDVNPETYQYGTNPCVAEGTLVDTPSGYHPVEDVSVGDEVRTVRGSETVDEIFSFDDRPVYRIEFSDGGVQRVTPDHRYHACEDGDYSKDFEDIPVRDLSEGDKVRVHERTGFAVEGNRGDYEFGVRQGILLGDGSYTSATLEQHNRVSISSSISDESYNDTITSLFEEYRIGSPTVSDSSKSMAHIILDGYDVIEDHNLDPAKSPDKSFDDGSIQNESHAIGLIDGLVASDGNINLYSNHPQLRFDTTSEDLAHTFRRACLYLGIHGRITVQDGDTKSNGEIDGRKIQSDSDRYTVNVSGRSFRQYAEQTNLHSIHPEKGSQIQSAVDEWRLTGDSWLATIESIEPDGTEDVYDLYCSGSDTWITSGYVQRGCAEQILMEEEACNLGHVNLSLMVDESSQTFDEWLSSNSYETNCGNENRLASMYLDHAIDNDLFEETVETGVRFLDNVVTRSNFPVESISECVESNRKIGLGVMGFAQMLIQMGVEYGSAESYAIAEELMRRLDATGTRVSHDLAEERGSFGNWEQSKYADPMSYPDWFRKHVHEEPSDWEDGYPIRNHNITTVAPTGTTSRVGDTTGGCEPIYNTVFFKNVSDDIQGDEMLVVFDDYLERTLESNNIDVQAVKEEAVSMMKDNEFDSIGDVDIVPEKIDDVFVTAEDLSIDQHLTMQAAFQTYCDSGISKTANAQFDATRNDISEALLSGLQDGIKGTTVYRQGSREEQVNTTKLDNKEFTDDEVDEIVDAVETLVAADDDAAERISSIVSSQNGGEN